jgi:hypothetical protein
LGAFTVSDAGTIGVARTSERPPTAAGTTVTRRPLGAEG